MLKDAKTKIALLAIGFLIICSSAFIAIKTFASNYSEILTYDIEHSGQSDQQNYNVVVVNGTEDVELDLQLATRVGSRIYSIEGNFAWPENYENPYYNHYISPSSIKSGLTEAEYDINTRAFSFECATIEDCYTIPEDSDIFTMTYIVSRNAEVGVYHMPIHINSLQTLDDDGNFDIHEENISFDVEIIVKRPSEITFWDEDNNPITEITKRYGDAMFTVTKGVTTGEGSINNYYVESESGEEGVAYIVTGTDYIDIHSTGDARICASTSDTEYYLGTTSCYTVHIEKRPIMLLSVIIADKTYDGTTNAEVSEVYFSDRQLDESEYNITNVTLDSPNVGEMRMASFDFSFTELGDSRYTYVGEPMAQTPAVVKHATLNDLTATITPQTYDPASQSQTVPTTVTAMFNGKEITIEEGVDYELYSHGQKVYSQTNFTEVGTYDITITPKMETSNFLFEPFDTTFTINPMAITVEDVQVDDKVYNESNEVHIDSIHVVFSEDKLADRYDYEVSGTLSGVNVGTWDAEVRIDLLNHNYTFYDEDEGTYSDNIVLNVPNVRITPLELTNENAYYVFNERVFNYTGERIEPVIPLFANVHGSHDSSELSISQDYIIEYSDDTINVGMKNATIIGTGNFTGSLETTGYYIASVRPDNIEITTPDKVYTGEALEPKPIITAVLNGNNVTFLESDYEIYAHDGFINAGSYTYTIAETLGGNYHISDMESTFTILPYEISSSDISLSENVYKYNGTSQTPSVTVTVGNTTISANDYDVEYSADTIGNDESDTIVTVTVRAKENTNISGEATTTYTITPREVLTIRGIDDNQRIAYNGSPVVLDGNVMVEENPGGINAEDLTVKWYASDGVTVIDRPTNAGSYKVVYSYEDSNYRGSLIINFEIIKANSPYPIETGTDFKIAAGQSLANLEGERTIGFSWVDEDTIVTQGSNAYTATYTYNGDTENYETLSLNIPVYGLAHVHVDAAESEGGRIIISNQDALEDETITITITPEKGRILNSITINGIDYTSQVNANTLSIIAGVDDIKIVTVFSQLYYAVIEGAKQTLVLGKDDNTATFRINANYELFIDGGAVYVDNVIIDEENYISWDGSTYVQLSNHYLNTLSSGTHELKVTFNDGGIAVTTFVIADSDSQNNSDKDDGKNALVPNTGFSTLVGGGVTATVSLLAIIMCFFTLLYKTRK